MVDIGVFLGCEEDDVTDHGGRKRDAATWPRSYIGIRLNAMLEVDGRRGARVTLGLAGGSQNFQLMCELLGTQMM